MAPPPSCRTPSDYFAPKLHDGKLQLHSKELRAALHKIQEGCAAQKTESACVRVPTPTAHTPCSWDTLKDVCTVKNSVVWSSMIPQDPAVRKYDQEVTAANLTAQAIACAKSTTQQQCDQEPRCKWDGQVCALPTYLDIFESQFNPCAAGGPLAGVPACVLQAMAQRSDLPPVPPPVQTFLQDTTVCLNPKNTKSTCPSSTCVWNPPPSLSAPATPAAGELGVGGGGALLAPLLKPYPYTEYNKKKGNKHGNFHLGNLN